jgi:hypothetical protein
MQALPLRLAGLPVRPDRHERFMPHPVGEDWVNGTDVSGIKNNVDDIQRACFQIGMPLPTTQYKYIPHPDRERPPTKGHQTRTSIDDDDFPKLVPMTGIGRVVSSPNYREGTSMLLGQICPVKNPEAGILRVA